MKPSASRDERHMGRALDLAVQGLGRVEPNPMVGAVIVQGDRTVGEGCHARFGGPHAEVEALRQAGPAARGAELFVSLEPCCHHGKTPPCTDAILAAGVRRVVAAVADPFPQVSGRGLAVLKAAGVETAVGILEEKARRLNAAFFKRTRTGLPLVIAKWAMTADGRVASAAGDSRWISSEGSRRRVHEVRRICDAVAVGAGTALADGPQLTVRHVPVIPERGQPARVVLDEGLAVEASREPFRSARETPVILYTTQESLASLPDRAAALRQAGCELVAVPRQDAGVSLAAVLADMGRRGWSRVLVEGGPTVFGSFFAAGLVDRVMIFVSPRILGSAGAPGPVAGPDGRTLAGALPLADMTVEAVGPDLLIQGRLGEF
jgi:diaminohydroxyphosphoribosylaminopyrimidine deaminase/5-amino-6-(5-phosphoribosylamino)uracil reductase